MAGARKSCQTIKAREDTRGKLKDVLRRRARPLEDCQQLAIAQRTRANVPHTLARALAAGQVEDRRPIRPVFENTAWARLRWNAKPRGSARMLCRCCHTAILAISCQPRERQMPQSSP